MKLSSPVAEVERGQRVFWFDAVRGLSALAVCAGHLRAARFCDRSEIAASSVWHAPFYVVTGLGHQAVMVFFVLSGYFVGGSVLRQRSNFSWSEYSVARLSRLWTVLVPALLFTLLVDTAVSAMNPTALAGGYQSVWRSGPVAGEYVLDTKTFLINLAFLQTISGSVFGSNGPLWSLANEFWYYALFPLGVAVVSRGLRAASVAYLVAVIGLLWWLPAGLVGMGVVWLFGVGVGWFATDVRRPNPVRVASVPALLGLFALALVATKLPVAVSLPSLWVDLGVGAAFAVLASSLVGIAPPGAAAVRRLVSWLSDVSYTLYLFHFPLVVAVGALVMRGKQFQPTAASMLVYATLLAAILATCSVAWFAFERNTPAVRLAMTRLLRMERRPGQFRARPLASNQTAS